MKNRREILVAAVASMVGLFLEKPAMAWPRRRQGTTSFPSSQSSKSCPPRSLDRSHWMGELAGKLGHKSLREMVIPGTHDSGTSLINPDSDLSPDAPAFPVLLKLPKQLVNRTIATISKTQPTTVYEQLRSGIRYLDLRLCWRKSSHELYVVHGMYSHKLSVVLDDIARFIANSPQEILIVDFQHFFNMTEAIHELLRKDLLARFMDRLIPRSANFKTPIHSIWEKNQQIVVIYGNDTDGTGANAISAKELLFWPRSSLRSTWMNTSDIPTLKRGLDAELHQAPTDKLFILQAILSPDVGSVVAHSISAPQSLEDMARSLAPLVPTWIGHDWAGCSLNVVIVDWYNQADFIGACIAANTG